MVRALAAILLLVPAVSASPVALAPAAVSFEGMAAELQASVAALRAAQIENVVVKSGPRIDSLAWDLERYEREAAQARRDLRWLESRLRRYQRPQPGRPDSDPNLRWDVQRFTRELSRLARDASWRLNDLRHLTAGAVKDDALVSPAQRLQRAAQALKSETHWLEFDARFAASDFRRAGFTFEAMDLDRDSRDLDSRAQDLQDESGRLLAKVSGLKR
jgi:hypothetical protein